ncbi:MAG: histidine kinase [Oscillospiraceae bacterium]|nr:histidine kinase [Oscillospiraceae bacterium]
MLSAYDRMERRMDMERELNEGKIRLLINQIRPHFINNVMTTIRSMIRYDPDEAERMVYRFTQYLGYNIDALTGTELCPFSMELDHIRAYLEIEQAHLRPRLRVEYDVAADDFELPPLSVLPFVENAVKHGIAPKQGTGTLTVATRETDAAYVIRIEDDGVGFDVTQPFDTRGGHGLGLNNARERLALMVNGTVELSSAPGQGTRVCISIPKLREEDFDENDIS